MHEIEDRIRSYKDTPWCSNPKAYQNIVHEDDNVIVFKDRFPVTEGHLLYVPKKVTQQLDITRCFELAYEWGIRGVMDYRWEAFNVGINNGEAAGQTVMWPHVHLIPRRKGDNPNPRGGVRNVIPHKADYTEKNDERIQYGEELDIVKNHIQEENRLMTLNPLGYDAIKDIDEIHQRNRRSSDDPYIQATMIDRSRKKKADIEEKRLKEWENEDYKRWKNNTAERR